MYLTDILASIEKSIVAIFLVAGFTVTYFAALLISEKILCKEIPQKHILCLTSFVFGLLAIVAGIVTGASRSAAVSDVLPAALGLIGAVALYVVTREKSDISIASSAVVAFSTMLLLGTVLGSYERVRSAAYQSSQQYDFERLKNQADIEFVINGYRRSRGLSSIELGK